MDERNILVVDDSLAMRKVVRGALEGGGFPSERILEAEDGAQALQVLDARSAEIGLVLCDWIMPGVDGLEVLRRMRRSDRLRDVPLIMVTCQGNPDCVVQAMQEGARNYVVKPFRPETLRRKVQDILGVPLDRESRRAVKIMVVDDSDSMRKMLTQAIQSVSAVSASVIQAGDGVEAMALLAKQSPPVDLIFADLEMPNMDGLELLRQMRVFKPLSRIPFVMVSSSTRQDKLQQVMKEGATAVLSKPFQSAAVRQKVEELLVGHDAESLPTDVSTLRRSLAQAAKQETARISFLSLLPEGLRMAIESRAKSVTHAPGTALVKSGESVTAFRIIQSGEAEVFAGDKVVEVRRAGDAFGYSSFLSGDPSQRASRARSELTEIQLDQTAFETVLQEHPYFAVYLTRLLARHAEKTSENLWSKVGVGFTGQLGAMSMVEVIQTIHGSLKTGTLRLSRGAESGEVYVVEGEIQAVAAGAHEGERAFYEMLRWDTGSFSFQAGARATPSQGLPSTMQLLMEGMRLVDEAKKKGR